jgi:hypothetical protein
VTTTAVQTVTATTTATAVRTGTAITTMTVIVIVIVIVTIITSMNIPPVHEPGAFRIKMSALPDETTKAGLAKPAFVVRSLSRPLAWPLQRGGAYHLM